MTVTTESNDVIIAEVLAAEDQRLKAIDAEDWKALDLLLGDDLTYVHSSGLFEDKTENMAKLVTSPRSYTRNNLKVRLYGDIALMTGDIDITIHALPDGTPARLLQSTVLQAWAKRDGRWQMIAFQATLDTYR